MMTLEAPETQPIVNAYRQAGESHAYIVPPYIDYPRYVNLVRDWSHQGHWCLKLADPSDGLHRDPDTIATLRALESSGEPILPHPGFNRLESFGKLPWGFQSNDGSDYYRAAANGAHFFFQPMPLPAFNIFNQAHWGAERGWLLLYCIRDSKTLNWRYEAWDGLCHLDEDLGVENLAIYPEPVDRTQELLEACMDVIADDWMTNDASRKAAIIYLFKWFLFGFGHPLQQKIPELTPELRPNAFNDLAQIIPPAIKLLMLWPRAHFSYFLQHCSDLGKPWITQRMPTKKQLAEINAWLRMRIKDYEPINEFGEDYILVFPHATGPGLLAASNITHTVIPVCDEELIAVAAILDCYLLAPDIAMPPHWRFIHPANQPDSDILAVILKKEPIDFSDLIDPYYFPCIQISS